MPDLVPSPGGASIQPVPVEVVPDAAVDATGGPPLWACPRCGHRFVTRNLWHSCSQHEVDAHFGGAEPGVRAAFDRLVELYEQCGPIVVIAQKSRIVFMVRVRFGGCQVRRDRLLGNVTLDRHVDSPRWTRVEQIGRWFVHRFEARSPADLDDPTLAELICESYHRMGEQGRLTTARRKGA